MIETNTAINWWDFSSTDGSLMPRNQTEQLLGCGPLTGCQSLAGLWTIFRIGNPQPKPSFPIVTVRGPHPNNYVFFFLWSKYIQGQKEKHRLKIHWMKTKAKISTTFWIRDIWNTIHHRTWGSPVYPKRRNVAYGLRFGARNPMFSRVVGRKTDFLRVVLLINY